MQMREQLIQRKTEAKRVEENIEESKELQQSALSLNSDDLVNQEVDLVKSRSEIQVL